LCDVKGKEREKQRTAEAVNEGGANYNPEFIWEIMINVLQAVKHTISVIYDNKGIIA